MAGRSGRRTIPFREIAPNMVTSGNLLCGMLSLALSFHGKTIPAAWLIFAAVFFDFLDGRIARSLGGGTRFGLEFDSLADMVSFGAAPAILAYAAYTKDLPLGGVLAVSFFALCGALRLARFNVVHAPGPFQGLPIPAGGLFLASLVLAEVHPGAGAVSVLCAAAGGLMISSIPYSSLKGLRKGRKNGKRIAVLLWAMAAMAMVLKSSAPLAAVSLYIAGGILRVEPEKWFSRSEAEETAGEKKY